ncbi:accessory factor associated with RNA polymerase II [Bonamia ostreae]
MVDRKKILRIIKNSNLTSKELEKKQTGGIVKKLKKSKILKIHDDEIFTYSINGYNQCPSLKPKECFELIAKFETVLKRERRGIDIKSKKVQNDPDSKNKVPIILVPSAVTALINIYNAQNFLENNQFVACGEDNLLIRQKNRKINVQLTKNSERKIFRLTDSIHNIEEWDNVVAVIVSGKNWQFKKYKYKPPMLFSKIKGFYFQWDGQSTERHIQNWNVEILKISRNNRNKDQKVVFDFWKILSAFLEKVKFSY